MDIISEEEYVKVIDQNIHHLQCLENIVRDSGDMFEGNCFYQHSTFNLIPELVNKQRNIYSIAKYGTKILEVGFNAGHSALLFLLSNPEAYICCFDTCEHKYTLLCFEYLNENFNNRLTLYIGKSTITLQEAHVVNPSKKYDIIHIDGCHRPDIANIDFFLCRDMAHNGSYLIWNGVQNQHLTNLYNGYIDSKTIENISEEFLETTGYMNSIGKYILKEKLKIAVCSLTVGEQYKEATKYGRLSKKLYCENHGYAFYDEEDCVDFTRPLAWSKIPLLLMHIKDNFDYLVWIDGDSYIMNMEIELESIIDTYTCDKDITIAQDFKLPNTGVMIIKNTKWAKKFLELIYDQTQFINSSTWEQDAFLYLHEHNVSDSKNHINILPLYHQTKLNSYWYNYNYNDCFILHFPGCSHNITGCLSIHMNTYCPIRKDDESEDEHKSRLYWLEYQSRDYIDAKLAMYNVNT
jgi:hypothetical protein